MAVDVLVMPLARYISGNYVTPFMEQAWADRGVYRIASPGGLDEIPPGVPLGGLEAEARCATIAAELVQHLQQRPEFAGIPWDELAGEAVLFQRIGHEPLFDLRWEAAIRAEAPPSWLRRLARRLLRRRVAAAESPLASASIFLPAVFDQPFELESPQDMGVYDCGSLPRLIEELTALALVVEEGTPSGEALATLFAAANVASEAPLPLILDF